MFTFDIQNLAVFLIGIITFGAVLIDAIRMRIKLRNVSLKLVQSETNGITYMIKLAEMVDERDKKSIEQTEGFLKFVSDSRDWAFQYIEDVQDALNEYDAALNTDDANIINEAYKKLIGFLPNDNVVK